MPEPEAPRGELPYVPPQLLDAANGPIADTIEIVIAYLDNLSGDLSAMILRHLNGYDATLRVLSSGLRQLRAGHMPSDPELDVLSSPNGLFVELKEGLEDAINCEPIERHVPFIKEHLLHPISALSTSFLSDPAECALVMWWADDFMEKRAASKLGPAPR